MEKKHAIDFMQTFLQVLKFLYLTEQLAESNQTYLKHYS